MTYAEKLKDPRWQKKRLEVLERAGWLCQLCGDSSTQLHVHHPKYVPGCEPWDYENLISLCANCHSAHHAARLPDVDPFWFMVQRDANLGDQNAVQLLAMREAGTLQISNA